MWYKGNGDTYYYVFEPNCQRGGIVYRVWEDGLWTETAYNECVVNSMCQKIERPHFGERVERGIKCERAINA